MDSITIWIAFSLISVSTIVNAQVYRCSKSAEACVFPFEDDGVVYNECASSWSGYWCKTAGSYGWAYCDICPEDLTSTTTTSTTTTTTTPPTTTSTTTTPTTTTSSTISTSTSTLPTTTTSSTISTSTSTLPTTTITSTISTSTSTLPTTTITSTTISSSTSTKQTEGKKADADLDSTTEEDQSMTPFDEEDDTVEESATENVIEIGDDSSNGDGDVTTHGSTSNDQSSVPEDESDVDSVVTEAAEDDGTTEEDDIEPSTSVAASTEAPATVCTYYGNTCKFPFEYGGVVYNECVGHAFKRYGWCYTDDQQDDYEDCYPCGASTTSAPTTTTTTKSPTTSHLLAAPGDKHGAPTTQKLTPKGTVGQDGPLSSPQPENSSRKSGTTGSNNEDSSSAAANAKHNNPGSDEPLDEDMSGPGKVAIIVVVLSILAVLVILAMIILYIRKLRRSKQGIDTEKNGGVGESGEGLLSQNKNGNHKTVNDGNSQEMQPLNSKKENAGGDCDVISEKVVPNGTSNVIA